MPARARLFQHLLHGLCALLLCICSLSPAQAHDLITDRAWLDDPNGQLRWPDVQQQATQPYSGLLSKGFGDSVIWLKLRIDPQAHLPPKLADPRLLLRIRPVYLDDIQVYDPLSPQGLAGVTGDAHHPRRDEFQGLDFLVPIERGTQPRDIWLRLQSTSTRQIDVQAVGIHDLNHDILPEALVFTSYASLVLMLALWGLVYWLLSREHLIGIFSVKQFMALLYSLGSMGFLRAYWPDEWPSWLLNRAFNVFSVVAVSSAIWFHIRLIGEFDPPPWIRRLHQLLLAILPLKLGLLLGGYVLLALRINMIEVLINPVIFLVSVILARGWSPDALRPPYLPRRLVLMFYVLVLMLLLLASLPALGWVGGVEVSLYIVQVHGLASAFLVLLMLQYRAHIKNQQHRQMALSLELSQLHVQQERDIRTEQEKLIAMLAHELKTPLATMHMRLNADATGSREIRLAIRDMSGVIERCLQTLQLSDRQLEPHPADLNMADLLREVVSSSGQPHRVQMDAPAQLRVHSDRQLWFIVLNNLLENAYKYAAPDSPIQIRLSTITGLDEAALLQVEMSNLPGPAGWPDPDKIFEKYYRSPHARRQAGTGLGLYLVRNLMQVMGGRIDYSPTEQQVRFVLKMPLHPASMA